MKKKWKLIVVIIGLVVISACSSLLTEPEVKNLIEKTKVRPNIIMVYVDDLGFGDIGVNGAKGVETPYIDSLAASGVNFTDAHASSATCTPSRYSLLTGEYAFRKKGKVLPGDAPSLIEPGKANLASLLKQEGYATAVIGKWHLGLGDGELDWNQKIEPGPNEIGFDYSFLIPATGDRVPTVFVEDGLIVNLSKDDPISVSYGKPIDGDLPTGRERPDLLKVAADRVHSGAIVDGVSRIGFMKGGKSAEWRDELFPDVLNEKALSFIRSNKDKPFFLYYSYHDIHVPRLPHPRFKNVSSMGDRGDAIVQMDWMTGQIMEELKLQGIEENTIIIFSSDNGPVLNDGYSDQAAELLGDHRPGGPFRGAKYSAYEAGARVPLVISWPGKIEATTSDATVSQVDCYASITGLLKHDLRNNEAIDSIDFSNTLFANGMQGREYLFKESSRTVSLRLGNYKYIEELDAIPNMSETFKKKNIETGFLDIPQLYDLSKDVAEKNNMASQSPDLVDKARNKLELIRARKVRER